jgi:hypothetical protein
MASDINYSSIDETYPIAGKDNDSQGFRDNFGYIKTSLRYAKSEIEILQNNTAKTNTDNSFNYQTLSKLQVREWGETLNDAGTIGSTTGVSYSEGSVQTFNVDGDLTLILTGFPKSGIFAKLRIQLTSNDNATNTVTFEIDSGTLKKNLGIIAATATYASGGALAATTFVVSNATGISIGQLITGTGIPADTYVTNLSSTTVTISKAFTIHASGTYNFYNGSTKNPIVVSSATDPTVIDFWTYDSGLNVFMDYVGHFV